MADPVSVQLVGLPEAQAAFTAIGEGVQHLAETHQAIAALVAERAAGNVPNTSGRGTGALAGSLTPVGEDQAASIESELEYAGVIERDFGYTQRAIDASQGEIIALYEAGIGRVVAEHGG